MGLDALVEEVASLPLPDDDSPEAWEVFTDRRASLVEQIQRHVDEWGADSLSAQSRTKLLLSLESLNQRLEQVAVVQSERKSEIQEQRDKRFQLANYRNRRKASRGYSRGSAYA